ncbi:LysR family transcriptional regulator [Pseudomonas sp. BN102]|uniref:LysR family transcriptional regulator n=1 Tax=Pseudomonas sp. BN102 TaxID=2567886 RepID=UPI00245887DE|nr:LysR family transcriptional regulator [Pseudomonas sp. BN102]MDH4612434.1 LysR family transcriptional regulator [Pseudomonas sp. BN102]
MKDLFSYRLFTRVARLGSFSAAARENGLSQSQVSRVVADLEADLGTQLLVRSTRAVVPTEAGAEFLSRMEPILAAVDEAELSVREGGEFRGIVRISMPTSVGIREMIPRMASFSAKHPNLHIQVLLADHWQDLVRDNVDVAIRLGRLSDSSATSRQIMTIPRFILASPSYLRVAGEPTTPEDLQSHRIIGGPAAAVQSAWTFKRDGETRTIKLEAHFSTDENEGAVAAAAAGLGITSTTAWACRRELESGELVTLLNDWATVPVPVHAYFPHASRTRSAGRALIEHLVASLLSERPNASSSQDESPTV